MSYDIEIIGNDGNVLETEKEHSLKGGTYAVGGTTEAWLNITYNYSSFFRTAINEEKGVRFLYGKSVKECIPILEKAIHQLGTKVSDNYWEATAGNAGKALFDLLELCKMFPEGTVCGD